MKRKIITTSILLGLLILPSIEVLARTMTHTGFKTSVSERVDSKSTNPDKPEPINVDIPETKIKLKETTINQSFWATHNLNMRDGAGVAYKKLLTIPKNMEVKAIAKVSNGWFKVQYSGKSGYVAGNYLSKDKINVPKPTVSDKTYSPMTIYFPDKTVSFKNGGLANGQQIIDKNIKIASTWGGAETFSGADGKNSHIVGHNPGAFTGIWNYGTGAKITIVDHSGVKTTYAITNKFLVDDNGMRIDNGENMYDYITSTRGGEVVTFQTCKNSAQNWIIRAEKVN